LKVAGLRTFVVGNPPPSFGGRYFVFLTLTTDDGITGVGEVYAATFHPRALESMIADVFDHHVHDGTHFVVSGEAARDSAPTSAASARRATGNPRTAARSSTPWRSP